MLSIQSVTKTYGKVTAVDDLSLELKPGVVGLIGHNGAGKTSLMQMIATLTKPTAGRIEFNGVDIAKRPDAIRTPLGFLPQDFGVYPHLTAREFLRYFAALKGVADGGRIQHLLERVNLHEHADRMAATFSGGMRQRLGIAQALLNDPDILIVDEPTAGLDPGERLRFRHLLAEIGFEKLVIVSTHIVSDIENMAQQIAVMRAGKLIAFSAPETILASARGQVWEMSVDAPLYAELAASKKVLQAQREGDRYLLRLVQGSAPSPGARQVEPSLEEALMTSQYLAQAA
ncbi:MAG: ABC transporter ATP-binding protein [Burkholderiales bacterium]|nr:ABC transporter ATP-binding protein [Burkholderiales bacterium]